MATGTKRSVCVIGAGPAGLVALRHFSSRPEHFGPIVAYEQTDQIGGTWNYSELIGADYNGLPIYSSVYRDLRTNLPLQLMAVPDCPYQGEQSYVHHSKVLQYLQQYVRRYDISRFIEFGHKVQLVTRDATQQCWTITVENLWDKETLTQQYDVVVVSAGKNCSPKWPKIDQLSLFAGSMIHSHHYRTREPYTGQRVGVIGAGRSGIDICLELSTVAREVIFINRKEKQFTNLPANVRQIKGTVFRFSTANSFVVRLANEESLTIPVDSIIMATGFNLCMQFLDARCGVCVRPDNNVDGLFRHLINIEQPSMAVLSILHRALSFSIFDQQMRYYVRTLLGEARPLPSIEQMRLEVEADLAKRKALHLDKNRHAFTTELLEEYFELLHVEGNFEAMPPVVLKLYREVRKAIEKFGYTGYRTLKYRIIDDERFEVVEPRESSRDSSLLDKS